MRIMVGFTRAQADEYALDLGWQMRPLGGLYTDLKGQRVLSVRGDTVRDAEKLQGVEVAKKGGIIWGPERVDGTVRAYALAAARL